jgi:hypothetical protein
MSRFVSGDNPSFNQVSNRLGFFAEIADVFVDKPENCVSVGRQFKASLNNVALLHKSVTKAVLSPLASSFVQTTTPSPF